MAESLPSKVFWSGGSQAVRLPKPMRLDVTDVLVQRRGRAIVIEPVSEEGWGDFWDRLVPLGKPVRRWKTRPVERRRPL